MPANEYLIPFGVDPRKFFEGLNAMDDGTEKLATTVKDAGAGMQKAFDGAAGAGDKLGKTLDVDAKKAQGLKETAKIVGKELGTALDGQNLGAGLESKIDKVKKSLEGVGTGNKGIKIPFDFDEAKLQHFEQLIASGADELQVLNQVLDFSKQKLATLDPDSEEFAQLNKEVQTAEQFLKEYGDATETVTVKQKSLKAQLKELKAGLAEMEIAGKGNTQEFKAMSIKAGELEDQIGDVSHRVKVLASDSKYLDAGVQALQGLAGGFVAAQGAAALFGNENQAVNEVIQKVTGGMAVLQGVQAVAAALNKDSALSVLLLSKAQGTATVSTAALATAEVAETEATVAAEVATRGFTASLLANPVFLIIAGLAACVAALFAFTSGSNDAEEAAKTLNETLERQNTLLGLDEGALSRRTALLVSETKLKGEQALAGAKTDAERIKITQQTENELTRIEGKSLAERANLLADKNNELTGLLADRNFIEKLSAEDLKKLQNEQQKTREDYLNAANAVNVKENEFAVQKVKQGSDLRKQENTDRKEANAKSIADAQAAAEKRKAIIEQEIKFRRDIQGAYIEAILDTYEKDKQSAIKATNDKIEDLQREKSLSVEAEKEKNELISALRKNLSTTLADIDKKRETDRANLLFEGQQKLADLQADGVGKELEISRLSFEQRKKEINEQFKNEGALRVQLLTALETQRVAAEKKINDAAKAEAVKTEEERQILEVETAARFAPGLPLIEEQKQLEILRVKKKFADAALLGLKLSGKDESDIEVLKAKKVVQDLDKAINDGVKDLENKGGGFDIFKMLGLDNLDDKQRDSITKAFSSQLESVRGITDFIVSQYQRQIEAKQSVIDQETDDIQRLEDQLDEEKSLRADGLASNVEGVQQELDAKKAQREQDLKDQEELIKKQQAIQRVQLAIDTATQASGLITSATNIFRSLSSIPFIGVPLAIATIALMTGAFVTAKVKAFQAVGDGAKQTFGGGGWIDGESHSRGGKKYHATDGSGDVVELEGGEHVTRKSQAEKYADLLDAINDDNLAGMTEDALRAMLGEMGIHLSADAPREAVTMIKERDTLRTELFILPGVDISPDVKEINRNVSFLAEREKFKPERWEDADYFYTKVGNTTSRTAKNKK